MEFYRSLDYRTYIQNRIRSGKNTNKKFTISRLAQAVGVESTYVTRVLKGKAQFNADQLFLVCEHLEFSEPDKAFLQLLLEYDRAYVPKRKKILLERIRAIQDEQKRSRKNLKASLVEADSPLAFQDYYLDPYVQIVHIFLTLPECQSNPGQVKDALKLPVPRFQAILAVLNRLGLIVGTSLDAPITVLKDHLHVSDATNFYLPNQLLLRALSQERILRLTSEERYAFAVTFSGAEGTKRMIQEEFMSFLKRIEPIVRSAEPRKVFQINFDLFPWSDS